MGSTLVHRLVMPRATRYDSRPTRSGAHLSLGYRSSPLMTPMIFRYSWWWMEPVDTLHPRFRDAKAVSQAPTALMAASNGEIPPQPVLDTLSFRYARLHEPSSSGRQPECNTVPYSVTSSGPSLSRPAQSQRARGSPGYWLWSPMGESTPATRHGQITGSVLPARPDLALRHVEPRTPLVRELARAASLALSVP